jgi:hypothetical protein
MNNDTNNVSNDVPNNIPTNEQAIQSIEKVQAAQPLHDARTKMSPLGKRVVDDVMRVLDDLKTEIDDKNEGDLLQQSIVHARNAKRLNTQAGVPSHLHGKASLYGDYMVDLANSLVQLVKVMITSTEVKTSVKDILIWLIQSWDEDKDETDVEKVEDGEERVEDYIEKDGEEYKGTHGEFVSDNTSEKRYVLSKKMKITMDKIASKSEYNSAATNFVQVLNDTLHQAKTDTERFRSGKVKQDQVLTQGQNEARLAIKKLRTLLENTANHTSLQPVIDSTQDLTVELSNDDDFMKHWKKLYELTTSWLREPQEVDTQEIYDVYNHILYRLRTDYSTLWQKVIDSLKTWFRAFGDDEVHQTLATDMKTLVNDVFFDENGNPIYKPELVKDTRLLVNHIADQIAYLHIPKIQHEDESYKIELDNVVIKANKLLPKYVRIEGAGEYNHGTGMKASLLLKVSRIQASGENIAYNVQKKRGLFKIKDYGLADFEISGYDGISATVQVEPYKTATGEKSVRVVHCECTIDNLKIRLHDSRHNFLVKMLNKPIQHLAKKTVEKVVCQQLKDMFYFESDGDGDSIPT